LGWGGVSQSELLNSIGDACKQQQQRLSMQLDQEFLPVDPAEMQLQHALLLQQAKQQHQAEADAPSHTEMGIDAQIQRLLELKQFLRRTKQATAQQQQQQVILEDIVMVGDAGNALDGGSGLFASSALVTPMQSEW
jgi:hypothetical protein